MYISPEILENFCIYVYLYRQYTYVRFKYICWYVFKYHKDALSASMYFLKLLTLTWQQIVLENIPALSYFN